ncbi:hypothetical protein [Jidongwangia harbinensis]|uniref:hypothetical protein n=1 Tax=Jidongwangia harbinensis TaxID=2878561 RepID=UPI001CD9FB8B|nr:hypothetical protein [Jidongwangia harbinensis]MCA2214776.1 hypothetical protein [Jidongwangia harbinensis]
MTYRVEYNGGDLEVSTLDAALDNAKHAIAADVGPISGWTVEHDETINDWFVQGVRDGTPIGPTAVVTGPEPVAAGQVDGGTGDDTDGWVRRVSFPGITPAEAFGAAAVWLGARTPVLTVTDVSWQPVPGGGHELRIYYRDARS